MSENPYTAGPIDSSEQERIRFAWLNTIAQICFAVLIVLIPFRIRLIIIPLEIPPVYGDYTDILLFISECLLLVVLVFWGLYLWLARPGFTWGPRFITYPMIGFTAAGAVSAVTSISPLISWVHVVRLVFLFLFYLFVVNTKPSGRWLQIPMMLQVGVQSIVGTTQFLLQRSIGLNMLGELTLDPEWFGVSIVWAPGRIALRSYGLTDHPNILGGSLALGLVFLILMFPKMTLNRSIPAALTISLGLGALLLTFSRASWLGLAAGTAASMWVFHSTGHSKSIRRILVLTSSSAIIILPLIIATLPFLSSRFAVPINIETSDEQLLLSPEDRSVEERRALIRAANRLFIDNALTGTGLGTFPVALLDAYPDFEFYYQPVHFIIMDAAAETGLFGALFYVLAVGSPLIALRVARRSEDAFHDLVAANGMLVVVIVIGIFDYYFWFLTPGRLMHWFVWGVWGAFYLSNRGTDA